MIHLLVVLAGCAVALVVFAILASALFNLTLSVMDLCAWAARAVLRFWPASLVVVIILAYAAPYAALAAGGLGLFIMGAVGKGRMVEQRDALNKAAKARGR